MDKSASWYSLTHPLHGLPSLLVTVICPAKHFVNLQRCKRNPLLIGISGEVDEELAGKAAAVLDLMGSWANLFEILLEGKHSPCDFRRRH